MGILTIAALIQLAPAFLQPLGDPPPPVAPRENPCVPQNWPTPSPQEVTAAEQRIDDLSQGGCWTASYLLALHGGSKQAFQRATALFDWTPDEWDQVAIGDAALQGLLGRLPYFIAVYAHKTRDFEAEEWLMKATSQSWWEERPALASPRVLGRFDTRLQARAMRQDCTVALGLVGSNSATLFLKTEYWRLGEGEPWLWAIAQASWVREFGLRAVMDGSAMEELERRERARPSDVAKAADAPFLQYWFWGALCVVILIVAIGVGLRRSFSGRGPLDQG